MYIKQTKKHKNKSTQSETYETNKPRNMRLNKYKLRYMKNKQRNMKFKTNELRNMFIITCDKDEIK